jgi:hypothetical protein
MHFNLGNVTAAGFMAFFLLKKRSFLAKPNLDSEVIFTKHTMTILRALLRRGCLIFNKRTQSCDPFCDKAPPMK